jgi:hypothetical protein
LKKNSKSTYVGFKKIGTMLNSIPGCKIQLIIRYILVYTKKEKYDKLSNIETVHYSPHRDPRIYHCC